ncbi:TOM1-like protein 1 [Phlyctochytrium bullatum]|nr:TOM1-like protein 1 [Phlyctochytrium bullatum]
MFKGLFGTQKTTVITSNIVVVAYGLAVLDFFVNNCEDVFREEVVTRENSNFIQKFLIREDLAPENRGRMLEMIAVWAQKYETPTDIRRLYHTLLGLGYRFPNQVMSAFPRQQTDVAAGPVVAHLSPEERKNYVLFDVNLAANAVQVLLETLSYADKSDDLAKNELLSEFRQKCVHMQERIGRLISEVEEEDLVAQLLQANSDIVNALEQYAEALEARAIEAATEASKAEAQKAAPAQAPSTSANLIDIDFEREAAHDESIEDLLRPRKGRPEPTADDPFADQNASFSPYEIPPPSSSTQRPAKTEPTPPSESLI